MKYIKIMLAVITILECYSSAAHSPFPGDLPNDYVSFVLQRFDDKLDGSRDVLRDFKISIDISKEKLGKELNIETIFALIRNEGITGTWTYPDGDTTKMEYKIVRHRGTEDIYMESIEGYFLWEYISIKNNKLYLAFHWWYTPPATAKDLEIIEMSKDLISDSNHWHKNDDRDCADDIQNNLWSMFCALKHSSITISGKYNHHNTALQTVRFVIDDLYPNHGFGHTLMEFNNVESTTHSEIQHILELSKQRIQKELSITSSTAN